MVRRSREMENRKKEVKRGIILGILLALFTVGFGSVAYVLEYGPVKIIRYYILVYGLCYLAWVDLKRQIVPNRVLLILLAVRAVLFLPEILLYPGYFFAFAGSSVLGALIGMAVLFAGYFIGKKGIGMGDIKLFGVTGWYVGPMPVMTMMFLSLCFAAVYSMIKLLLRQIRKEDEIPFVPFVFAGVIAGTLLGV